MAKEIILHILHGTQTLIRRVYLRMRILRVVYPEGAYVLCMIPKSSFFMADLHLWKHNTV